MRGLPVEETNIQKLLAITQEFRRDVDGISSSSGLLSASDKDEEEETARIC